MAPIVSLLASGFLIAAEAPRQRFDLPSGAAEMSLKKFSEQSGLEVLFPTGAARAIKTNAVKGELTPLEALNRMVSGTGLRVREDEKSGAFAITPAEAGAEAKNGRGAARGTTGDRSRDSLKKNETKTPPTQEPMKRNKLLTTLAAVLGLLAAPADAQVAPASTSSAASTDPIELSPFTVTADSDEGYAARETLAGTRFKSELKDVPSQVSVMTKEFLEDIASVSIEDAYRYSANVENTDEFASATGAGGNFSDVINFDVGRRIRGLASVGKTHDFFQTATVRDTYNTERLTFSSGPNAIIFGNGNPGGIVDTTFKRAQLQRKRYTVGFRTDNYGTFRVSTDINQPIVKEKLGLRLATLHSRQKHWREPGKRDDDRYFGAVTFKPFKNTLVRAYYEHSELDLTTPRNTRGGDLVTPWIEAGRPAFNNGLDNPTVISAANMNNTIFARQNERRNIFILGAADPVPFTSWGGPGNIALPTTTYTSRTIGPGTQPNQTGTDAHLYSLPYDESITPFDVSINGDGTRNMVMSEIWGGALEQRLADNLFFEAAYNRERVKNPVSDVLRGVRGVSADANLFLPDRVTPNPNFGRYYIENPVPQLMLFRRELEESRMMLSYEFDLTEKSKWLKWTGRHRVAAMYQRSETMGGGLQLHQPRLVPAGLSPDEIRDNYTTFPHPVVRLYLSDPLDSSTGNTFYLKMPFDPLGPPSFQMPDGSTWYSGVDNPLGGGFSRTITNSLLEGQVLALQSFFLKDRLVTSFGWRGDRVRQASYTLQRKTTATSAFESIMDVDPPTNWSLYEKGNTQTAGAVGHILPWLSVFYNHSSTWNPPTGLVTPDTGSPIPGPTGEGDDYGFMLRFWDNRVSLRLNKYENTSGPAISSFRNPIFNPVRDIEQTLIDRTEDGTIPPPPPLEHWAPNQIFNDTSLVSQSVSKGYEFELVANPTKNWRIALNGAQAESTESDIGTSWVNFIEARAPVWDANRTLMGPDAAVQTIANRYLGIIQALNQMTQADGQRVESGRDWRANLVTRYGFSEGRLRGAFVGGGYRWRSKQVLGYRASLVENAFPFTGAPAEVLVPALDSPIWGEPVRETELFFGYSRRLGNKVNWRIQLNIRNVFDDQDPVGQRANITEGFTTVYAVPAPRSFILSSSFTF